MAGAGLPTLLLLLLAVGTGSALAGCPGCGPGVQPGCRGGCTEEGDAESPADAGCAEGGGCLRREGQPCGVYIPKCAPGLQCQPREDEEMPLKALLAGQGRCQRARGPAGESQLAPTRDRRGQPVPSRSLGRSSGQPPQPLLPSHRFLLGLECKVREQL